MYGYEFPPLYLLLRLVFAVQGCAFPLANPTPPLTSVTSDQLLNGLRSLAAQVGATPKLDFYKGVFTAPAAVIAKFGTHGACLFTPHSPFWFRCRVYEHKNNAVLESQVEEVVTHVPERRRSPCAPPRRAPARDAPARSLSS